MTYTLDQLRTDIAEIVRYNWNDERHDCENQVNAGNGASPHIFHVLQRLNTFVSGAW